MLAKYDILFLERGGTMRTTIDEWVRESYGLDLVEDILLNPKDHLSCLVDFKMHPGMIHVLSGDLNKVGLPLDRSFAFSELRPFIMAENTLSEVQGSKTFIKDLYKRIKNIEGQKVLHIPIRNKQTYWLRILFKIIQRDKEQPALLFAQVLEIHNKVPDLIEYYRKTHQDSLTKLFTRETLKKHMDNQKHTTGAYGMYLDLDHFKKVNDQCGHLEGDRFLKRLAQQFIDTWEPNVLYYRLGGDEFFVYIFDFSETAALEKAQSIIRCIESVGRASGLMDISASVGMVPVRQDMSYHALLDASDRAMYASKDRGAGNITLINKDTLVTYDRDGTKKRFTQNDTVYA